MKRRLALVAALMLVGGSALAQDQERRGPPTREQQGPTTSGDVMTQGAAPAPENGNIILKFGDTTQIYFRQPIKSVRLSDGLLVSAEPKSDHIVAFTGLSPGQSKVIIEATNGNTSSYGLVTVVRELHVVKIYQRGEINRQSGERRSDSSSAIGGYVTLNCNEIGCSELEPDLQARLPK